MALMKKVIVGIPVIPNFIIVGTEKVSIADMADKELKAVAKEWTMQLLKAAREKRKTKKNDVTSITYPEGVRSSSPATASNAAKAASVAQQEFPS